jgi:hypothetical protein
MIFFWTYVFGKSVPHSLPLAMKLGFISLDNVNPESNRHWSAENSVFIHEELLNYMKGGV